MLERRHNTDSAVHARERLFRLQNSPVKGLKVIRVPILSRMARSTIISGQLWMRQFAAPVISVRQ
jgi:hypothetical protein